VVYYGVPNEGSEAVARRLSRSCLPVPLGINLVETNIGLPSGPEETIQEMIQAAKPFLGIVDYLALNLNCPNTTGGSSPFDVTRNIAVLLDGYGHYGVLPPMFLKIPPTTDPARIDGVLEAVDAFPFLKGVIFNLPPGTDYPGLKTPSDELSRMPGTLAGRPARDLIDASVRAWYPRMDHSRHVMVGVGGVYSAEDAYEKIRLGASLVQLNTSLVYHGPGVAGEINRGLCRLLERDGLKHISEAVGVDNA
jgi:dihydroorotate dehydrogenase (fumarate)/dihydroorotate dehydrogenase